MSRRRKIVLTVAAVLVFGLLFTAFVLPMILRSQLEKQVARATDRRCRVAKVYVNPLNWSAEVVGMQLTEKNSAAAFVSFSSLRLTVSPASVWRMAPVVAGVKLTSPYVHLQRNAPNSYNFSDIPDIQPKNRKSEPTRFSLNNIVIVNGRVVFDDKAASVPRQHKIDNLVIQVPFISNIPYFADRYVDPHLSALVNGAPFSFTGKLKPFEKGLEAAMDINLKGLDIPYYAPYFPAKLPVKVVQGKLSAGLRINHQLLQKGKPDINISGAVGLKDFAMAEPTGTKLLSLKSVTVDIASIGLLHQHYEIAKLRLEGPELYLYGDKSGNWNLSRLKNRESAEEADKKEEPAQKNSAKEITVKSLQLVDGTVHLKDERPAGGFSTELNNIAFSLDNFATKGELPAAYSLSLQTGRKETASLTGNISMEPLTVSSRIQLAGVVLEAAHPYLADLLNDPLAGRGEFTGDLAFSAEKGLTIDRAVLRVKDVRVPFGRSDGVSVPLLVAEGGSLKLKEKSLSIDKIALTGGKIAVSKDAAGKLSPSLLLKPKKEGAKPAAKAPGSEKPFSWKIGRISLQGLDGSFMDGSKEDQPKFEFKKIRADVASLKGPEFSEMPISLAANIGKGSLSVSGRLNPQPFRFKGDLNCNSFPFVDFDAYLPEEVNIDLIDGKLDAKLFLDLQQKNGKLLGSYGGDGAIRDFYSVDSQEENDLLKWEVLALEGFRGTLEPFTLSMDGLSLNNYFARIIINKYGRTNLQEIYRTKQKQEPAANAPATQPLQAKSRDVRIDTVTLSGGTLDFSDHHLNRDFATTMLNLGGRISGLSSDAASTADIDLRGNLENHSPLKISGKLNPLAKDLFLDMKINFSDIELSPLTPYSGTYLGYVIDKGKLSLAMNYKVENKSLTAENKVFLDQFTFGDKVESNKATSLPVRLAVALLKDKNGEIHLDLPLSGRTDSPKFSIWGVVGQMLKNLLVKAATSPFALLQASFGSGADFSSVAFPSGSSRLTAAEEGKLVSLAKALHDRPGIRLEILGFADRERDPEGYRIELLHRKMRNEKMLFLAKEKREGSGLKPGEVDILPTEESKWLKAVYEKEKFPRPRTVIGTLKSLPDAEMRKLILANTTVTEQQLRGLARERALAVMNFLLNEGKLPQERLFEKSADPFAFPEKDRPAGGRVEFGVVAH